MSVWGVGQTTVQRAMAAKSLRDAKLYVPFDGILYHCFIWQLLQKEKKVDTRKGKSYWKYDAFWLFCYFEYWLWQILSFLAKMSDNLP